MNSRRGAAAVGEKIIKHRRAFLLIHLLGSLYGGGGSSCAPKEAEQLPQPSSERKFPFNAKL
jgi:hypothetical protein